MKTTYIFLFILQYHANIQQQKLQERKHRHVDQRKRIESLGINPHIYSQLIFDEDVKTIQWGEVFSSTNGAGTAGYLHAKGWTWAPTSHNVQKLAQMDHKPKTIKPFEENTGNMHYFVFWQ